MRSPAACGDLYRRFCGLAVFSSLDAGASRRAVARWPHLLIPWTQLDGGSMSLRNSEAPKTRGALCATLQSRKCTSTRQACSLRRPPGCAQGSRHRPRRDGRRSLSDQTPTRCASIRPNSLSDPSPYVAPPFGARSVASQRRNSLRSPRGASEPRARPLVRSGGMPAATGRRARS
ncbi:hypothetical protein M885DRAFT_260871 [Pelagophyceae sp. CCMP2097]|nr:hypothetical protein M885DRAFT_260871 [Pelagophyceae sp. CCMP2097]